MLVLGRVVAGRRTVVAVASAWLSSPVSAGAALLDPAACETVVLSASAGASDAFSRSSLSSACRRFISAATSSRKLSTSVMS